MGYWVHEACFMPRSDFRLVRHCMLAPEKAGWEYKGAQAREHAAEITLLVQHIHDKGPICSADFEHPRKGANSQWEWKPRKRHLEGSLTAEKVVVIERRNFQRVCGLTHRVIPDWDDGRDLASQVEAETIMLDNSARSLGILREQWLVDYHRLERPALAAWRGARVEQQQIITVHVEKLGNLWLYADSLPLLERAFTGELTATHGAVLSPFDPVIWNRKRTEQLLNLSYRLECYIPASKHRYGYSVLPLLHRGQLVGRMDAKMYHQTGILEIIFLWLQKGVKPTTTL